MRFLRRSLTGLFLLAATLGLLAFAVSLIGAALTQKNARDNAKPSVRERVFSANVMQIKAQDINPVLSTFGELAAKRALDLRALTGGTVIEISPNFQNAGHVQASELLLRLDPTEFEFALQLARTDLAQSKAEHRDADAALELARDDLENAKRQTDLRRAAMQRQKDLVTRGVGTEAAVESASLSVSTAQQAVLAKRQSVINAQARVSTAKAAVERRKIQLDEAQRRLNETRIYGEISGILSDVTLLRGGVVTAGEKLGRIIDPNTLEAQFRLSAAQYARLLNEDGTFSHADIKIRLNTNDTDQFTSGQIVRESAEVGEDQSGRLIFANLDPSQHLRAGDFVTVEIKEPILKNVILLPAAALDPQSTVLILGADDRLEQAPVELLRRQGNNVIVHAPDLIGRDVVLQRTPALGTGIRIRPVRPEDGESEGHSKNSTNRTIEPEKPAITVLKPSEIEPLRKLIENSKRMPDEARNRLLKQLDTGEMDTKTLERLQRRMAQ